jgi:hypothetical protein
MADWMVDPAVCAGMTMGSPQVGLTALVDLQQLLMRAATCSHFPERAWNRSGESHEACEVADSGLGSADELDVRQQRAGRFGLSGARQGRSALAQILLQTAGVRVEELADDRR